MIAVYYNGLKERVRVGRLAYKEHRIFSSGPGGEHSTAVMREGKNPKNEHLLKLADEVGINKNTSLKIIAEVKDGINDWLSFAKQAHVSKASTDWIQKFLRG